MWQISGRKLREAMLNAGVGNVDLRALTGVGAKRIVELKAGGYGTSNERTVYKIAKALGVKPREILEDGEYVGEQGKAAGGDETLRI